jgi:hypothetical protein
MTKNKHPCDAFFNLNTLTKHVKRPCNNGKVFFNKYEQRGWEKFFTVKQRGKCLLVINFTFKIYHGKHTPSMCLCLISQYCQKEACAIKQWNRIWIGNIF